MTINNGPYQLKVSSSPLHSREDRRGTHRTFTNGAILAYEVEVNDKYFGMEGDSGIGATTTLALDK